MKEIFRQLLSYEPAEEIAVRGGTFILEILIAYVLWRIVKAGIDRYRSKNSDSSRSETISTLLKSTVKYLIYFFTFVTALDTLFKVNVMSILAAAGVVGIAVAFGAQSLVKDIITGFFIIFEGEFEVGDLVTIDGFTGQVNSITLRCTTLKNYLGDMYIIPNGSVEKVINHQKGEREVAVEVSIAYESDVNKALELMAKCSAEAASDMPEITGECAVQGVIGMSDGGVRLRVLVPCVPGAQYSVEWEMLRRVKYAFDENGIEIYHKRIVDLPGVINIQDTKKD